MESRDIFFQAASFGLFDVIKVFIHIKCIIYISIDTVVCQYGSIHQILILQLKGLNHESLNYESNTLTTAPSNHDDLEMK